MEKAKFDQARQILEEVLRKNAKREFYTKDVETALRAAKITELARTEYVLVGQQAVREMGDPSVQRCVGKVVRFSNDIYLLNTFNAEWPLPTDLCGLIVRGNADESLRNYRIIPVGCKYDLNIDTYMKRDEHERYGRSGCAAMMSWRPTGTHGQVKNSGFLGLHNSQWNMIEHNMKKVPLLSEING